VRFFFGPCASSPAFVTHVTDARARFVVKRAQEGTTMKVMKVNLSESDLIKVKLSDSDLIFLGAAAIMGPMLQATHNWDLEALYTATAVSAALLNACKDVGKDVREEGEEAMKSLRLRRS
jgi:hypothetical protein